jgi:hypothetical protein
MTIIPEGKLKIKFKGRVQQNWASFYLKFKINRNGVSVKEINQVSDEFSEVLLEGNKKNLWKALNHFKKPSPFMKFDRVVFQFLD